MANYNKVIMIGNLTRDPEYKTLSSGQGVCKLGLASNRQFRNRQTGAMIQEVCFIDIDVWGAQAESCRQYLQKGRPILVEGRLKLDSWQDQNGNTRNKHTIVADRVVFLSQAAADEEGQGLSAAKKDPSSELEKELLDQIDKIKEKATEPIKEEPKTTLRSDQDEQAAELKAGEKKPKVKAKAEKSEDKTPDVKFKDQPPFEDELPF